MNSVPKNKDKLKGTFLDDKILYALGLFGAISNVALYKYYCVVMIK